MKIIFLDIDGVLVPFQKLRPSNELEWSAESIEVLNTLCCVASVKVVISSQWRLQDYTSCREKMLAVLKSHGFTGELHQDWKTPGITAVLPNRGDEILEWLKDHEGSIDSWVVLEDFDNAHIEFPPEVAMRLVRPDSFVGLTRSDLEGALKLLTE